MPDPLDAAFAALGNDQAVSLLSEGLSTYAYAQQLAEMRLLVDEHPASYFEDTLYGRWSSALRRLSPAASELENPALAGLPRIAASEAWGRRILNTQLGSWAQLRHDTLLYAKQSVTEIPACEFPAAYVEPYPALFDELAEFAALALRRLPELGLDEALSVPVVPYFQHLESTMRMLQGMAEHQRSGEPFSSEQLEFINGMLVEPGEGCFFDPNGWYPKLVFLHESERDTEFDPTIADVHTQPADEAGGIVGRVLHVATGRPRLMVMTTDSCAGPRAYAGFVSSYFERVTENFERWTDPRWAAELQRTTPADVPWMVDLVSR